jgi:hypothetical protein
MTYDIPCSSKRTFLTLMILSLGLCGLIGCGKGTPSAPPGEAQYPFRIAWKTEVTQPVRVSDAPTIVYERIGDLNLKTVAWSVKLLSGDPVQSAPMSINCPVPVHVPDKKGTITGESGKWTQVVELSLSYFMTGVSGETKLHIALVEPQPQTEMPEDWSPRQLSNWLTLPIKLERD